MMFFRCLLGRGDRHRRFTQRMAGARGHTPSTLWKFTGWSQSSSSSSSNGLVVKPSRGSILVASDNVALLFGFSSIMFGMAGLYFALKNDIKGDLDKQSAQLLDAFNTSTIVNDARINAQNTKIDGQDRKINGQNGMINELDYKIDGQNSRIKSMGWWSSAP
jgi:hypothetical protein